ncbi:MAG: hypothetical protein AAF493_04590 [Pseudomonadota bacterium]
MSVSILPKVLGITAVVGLLGFAPLSQAAPVVSELGDHPDASLFMGGAGVPYGLRLDVLGGTSGQRTFSATGVAVTYDTSAPSPFARITGTITRNTVPSEIWDVTHEFGGVTADSIGTGFIATKGELKLTRQSDSFMITLMSEPRDDDVFVFSDDGHRLPGDPEVGFVGRGWLEASGTNDWLVTGTEPIPAVPLPGAALLFLSASIGVAAFRRRTRRG